MLKKVLTSAKNYMDYQVAVADESVFRVRRAPSRVKRPGDLGSFTYYINQAKSKQYSLQHISTKYDNSFNRKMKVQDRQI